MAATQRGELSAGMAILGLLIEQPDNAAGVGQRLSERFPRARFARSAVHNALPSLAEQGLVELFQEGRERALHRYCATDTGKDLFRAWLRDPSLGAPTLRDAVHARLAFAEPEDLLALIAAVAEEERACAAEYAAAQARLVSCRPPEEHASEWWRAALARLAHGDEATVWLTRLKRLQRLQTGLERLRLALADREPGTVTDAAARDGRELRAGQRAGVRQSV